MKIEKTTTEYLGILANISWNSNQWSDNPTDEDILKSNFGYVIKKRFMNESLNFGHEKFKAEKDGYYIGYAPSFLDKLKKNVQIVFFASRDYKDSNLKKIIGLYVYPLYGEKYKRTINEKKFEKYSEGNIKALPDNIYYFQNSVPITNKIAAEKNLLPKDKKLARRFNYLTSDNVHNIIKFVSEYNFNDIKLNIFLYNFLFQENLLEENQILENKLSNIIIPNLADTIQDVIKLEEWMKNKQPEDKDRVSKYIERGAISNKVKELNNFKCSVCEALGNKTNSFIKSNGKTYIETHHVEQVSTRKKGVLSISNLITICANHHRQMHYGNVKLIENNDEYFKYKIDNKILKIKKIFLH